MNDATLLQKANIRPTKIRQQILKILASVHALTADELTNIIQKESKADRATIYRNLKKLATKHIICKLQTGFGPVKFERVDHDHQHAICSTCQKIINITVPIPRQPLHLKNFTPQHTHLIYFGTCSACKDRSV